MDINRRASHSGGGGMSDLISRSELIRYINDNVLGASDWAREIRQDFIDMVEKQPVAYDVDKVVEQIVSKIEPNEDSETGEPCYNWVVDMLNDIYKDVIEIVKGGLEE
jgi:hypothetical protein